MVDEDSVNFRLVRVLMRILGPSGAVAIRLLSVYRSLTSTGAAEGFCSETAVGSGIFTRSYAKVTVSMVKFTPTITTK